MSGQWPEMNERVSTKKGQCSMVTGREGSMGTCFIEDESVGDQKSSHQEKARVGNWESHHLYDGVKFKNCSAPKGSSSHAKEKSVSPCLTFVGCR